MALRTSATASSTAMPLVRPLQATIEGPRQFDSGIVPNGILHCEHSGNAATCQGSCRAGEDVFFIAPCALASVEQYQSHASMVGQQTVQLGCTKQMCCAFFIYQGQHAFLCCLIETAMSNEV